MRKKRGSTTVSTPATRKKKGKTDREIGLEFQRWVKQWLDQHEYDTVNIPPRGILIKDKKTGKTRFISLRNDIFGCDLIARKIENRYGEDQTTFREIWIQAMVGYGPGRKLAQVSAHPLPKYFPGTYIQIETHVWMKVEPGLINIKRVVVEGDTTELEDLGKIIRGKFYAAEGINYDF